MTIKIFGLADPNIDTSAPINDAKLYHRYHAWHDATGTIVAATRYFPGTESGTGSQLALWAAITEAIAIGNNTVTIDLKKSTAGGAFASVLSSTLVLNSSNTLYIPVAATFTTTTFAVGDLFKLTVAVAGSGTQATGLVIWTTRTEAPS